MTRGGYDWLLLVAALWAAATPAGCHQLGAVLATVAQGSQYLASALDVADTGADSFFARHPDRDRRGEVSVALHRARLAQQALDSALSAAQAADAGELEQVRRAAVEAYADLRLLLEQTGVIDGTCHNCGGAETNAPAPVPLDLPSVEELRARL